MVLCDIVDDAAAAAAFDRAVAIESCSTRWLLERTLLLSLSSKRVFSRPKMYEIRISASQSFAHRVKDYIIVTDNMELIPDIRSR